MIGRTGPQQQGDAVDAGSASVTNGNGSPAVRAPVETAGPARRRRVVLAANLRLAVLAVMIVVVGAGAGYIGALLLPKQYAARAELHYSLSKAVVNELLREDRTLTTQLVLLRSRDVLGPVASDNGMTPEDLAENVSAEVVDSSEIIEVEVRDRTRERAQMVLTGVIARYLTEANRDWQDPVHSYLEFELSEVQKQLRAPDVSAENATELTQREEVLRGLLDSLQPTPSISRESPSGPPARVLTDPYPVAEPVSLTPLFAAATGATTAFVVAGFVVLLVVRRRLRS
jgi:uncharacterized protein involved in exopolysaccharide biosynthesis